MKEKKLLLMTTGGTIASVDAGGGLAPQLSGENLLKAVPQAAALCCETLRVFDKDSADMTVEDCVFLARELFTRRGMYDGFVITHGTDAMAYTAALLSRLLPDFDRPVILTGSQLPLDAPGSDAPRNLYHAFLFAQTGWRGVGVCFARKLMRGTHTRKVHTSEFDAFASFGVPCDGRILDGKAVIETQPASGGTPRLITRTNGPVPVLRVTPCLDAGMLRAFRSYPAVILEAMGTGGAPAALLPAVRELIGAGTRVYVRSQCDAGGTDLTIYQTGRKLMEAGAVPLSNKTAEDALAWVLVSGQDA